MNNYLNIDAKHCVATKLPIFFILQFILFLCSCRFVGRLLVVARNDSTIFSLVVQL